MATFTAQVRVNKEWVSVSVEAVSAYAAFKMLQAQYANVKWPTRSAW